MILLRCILVCRHVEKLSLQTCTCVEESVSCHASVVVEHGSLSFAHGVAAHATHGTVRHAHVKLVSAWSLFTRLRKAKWARFESCNVLSHLSDVH